MLRLLIVDSDLASVLSVKEAAADLSVACDITHCLDIAAFMRTWRQMTPLPDLILVSRSLHSTRTEPLDDLEAELLHQPIPLLLWIQGTGPGIVETRRAGWPTMPKPATTADYQRFVTSLITNIPSRTQHPTTVPVPSPRHGHLAP